MPFTLEGQWVPSKSIATSSSKPVKVRFVKRGRSLLTVILNLSMTQKELSDLASSLKKKLGCGGAVREGDIEVQGDKVEEVRKYLTDIGIKSS